jgi:DNA-binding HxlR family transcriptional regulator
MPADVIGDRWSQLIVRDAFDGVSRFGDFQVSLGVARNILANRLKALVQEGVLEVQPASDGTAYQQYVLTPKGEALFPVVVGLRQWGEGNSSAEVSTIHDLSKKEAASPLNAWRCPVPTGALWASTM